jgi:hypothetical protein
LLLVTGLLLIPVPRYCEPPLLKEDAVVPVVRLKLLLKIAAALFWPLALDHRESLADDTNPVILVAGSILE